MFGYRQALGTILIHPITGLSTGITIYRKAPERPFGEQERRLKQALTPHWVAALTRARIDPWTRRAARDLNYPEVAVVDAAGQLRYATEDFGEMLQREWVEWRGPELPIPLQTMLASKKAGKFTGKQIAATVSRRRTIGLVQIRSRRPADQLSDQLLKTARLSAQGLSFKEIARRMELSPATVRNYLSTIYSKLDIKNKVGLTKLLQDSE